MKNSALFYTRPAEQWLDGLPLGNGRLGAMVLPGPEGLRLQINDSTAWSGSPDSEHRLGQVSASSAAAALTAARAALADARPVDAERALEALQSRYSQAFLPFADVLVATSVDGGLTKRELRLDAAAHFTEYGLPGGFTRQESFISAADGVLVHQLSSTAPVDVRIRLSTPLKELDRRADPTGVELALRLPADAAPGHEPAELPVRWEIDGVAPVEGAVALQVRHDGSAENPENGVGEMALAGVTELLLVLATDTTFTGMGLRPSGTAAACVERARQRAGAALARGIESLRRDHLRAHRELFDRVTFTLGPGPGSIPGRSEVPTDVRLREANRHPDGVLQADPGLAALLFHYGRYLLICSSRPGTLPATLQGIWNAELQPPWSSNYTLNINAQMNYWGAEAAALPECAEPLMDLVQALADSGRRTAATLYGTRGWVAHHNTDAWAFSSPTSGHASWAQWPMAGPWLVRQLDERRRFGSATGADIARLWPLAVGCAEFLCDWLVDDGGRWLQTQPSSSPENCYRSAQGPAALTTSTAMDRTLITELFETVLALAPLVGELEHPIMAEVQRALPRIAPPAVGTEGSQPGEILEWGPGHAALDPQHRHLSHVAFIHPGNGTADPELAAAAKGSLDARGNDSTGWSLIWKTCLRARLGQPDKVSDLLRLLFREAGTAASGAHAGGLYPNLFAAHPPFQLDANLGYVAAIAEVLLQSESGTIRLLPALPPELASGQIRGLIARPGIRVDLEWHGGRLTEAVLTPQETAAGTRTIEVDGRQREVRLESGRSMRLTRTTGNHFTETSRQQEKQ